MRKQILALVVAGMMFWAAIAWADIAPDPKPAPPPTTQSQPAK